MSNTAVNPLEVLSGEEYTLPGDPKLLRVLVVQMAKLISHQMLPRKDEFSEKVSVFLERLDSDNLKLFNEKFRGYIDRTLEGLEADIALVSKYRKDWNIALAQSKSSVKFLEGLKGLRKKKNE